MIFGIAGAKLKKISLVVALSFASSGCAYYPDLYSVDTSQFRASVCASAIGTESSYFTGSYAKCPSLEDSTREKVQTTISPVLMEDGNVAVQKVTVTQVITPENKVIAQTVEQEEVAQPTAAQLSARVPTVRTSESPYANLGEGEAPKPLVHAIVQASWLQEQYETYYRDVSKINDILQLPVLIAAGASGLVALDGSANRTERVAEIGVLATTFVAGRAALTSPDMSEYYIKGHGALNCAIAIGMTFAEESAQTGYDNYSEQVGIHAQVMANLEATFGYTPKDGGDDTTKALLATARALATSTLVSARTSRTAALQELNAFEGATQAFHLVASNISVEVASKGQVRTDADLSNILGQFDEEAGVPEAVDDGSATPPPGNVKFAFVGGTRVSMANARNHTELANYINALVNQMLTANSTLEGYKPGYATSIQNLGGCLDIVKG